MTIPFSTSAHLIQSEAEALQAAEQFAQFIAQQALERDRDRILPHQEVEQFSQGGLWGITVPKEYGGAGVSTDVLTRVVQRIAQADGNFGHIPQNHYYALEVLRVGATHEQKAFFYDQVLQGKRFGNALAEIGKKDFVRRTQLLKAPDGWFVDGRKFYCTGSLFAHWIPTLTSSPDDGRLY
ncbi:MAG TPA: acyl-CoA dehydrogenase family protein, partial [Alcaligenes faecalis]|nr:acyl-CoA dehydrogenase family protein [Alcaligenes faecalis]